MTRQRTRWGLLAAAALALASASCAKKQTILLVEIYGPVDDLMIRQFSATVTAGLLDTKAFTMPAEPAAVDLTLPASFTLTLDQSRMGPITVSINAYDVSQSPVGFGTTTMDHIVLGGQTIIPVRLTAITDPGTADGGVDTGEDGQDAGQDTAQDTTQDAPKDAARDGAGGQDAGEDGMSLDAAAD